MTDRTFPRNGWPSRFSVLMATAAVSVVGLLFFSSLSGFAQVSRDADTGEPRPGLESAADAARRKELMADANNALKLFTAKRYQEFLELYAPVEMLRQTRRENAWADVARSFLQNPDRTSSLIRVLRGVKTGRVTFEAYGGEAVVELLDPEAASVVTENRVIPPAKKEAVRIPEGYGDGNLKQALDQGVAALKDEDFEAFVLNFYPVAYLQSLGAQERLNDVVASFAENESLLAQTRADLQALKTLEPTLSSGGAVATFTLPAADASAPKARSRTVKFQKTDNGWRFFDASANVTNVIEKLASAKPVAAPPTIRFEKIGGNWRFLTFDEIFR